MLRFAVKADGPVAIRYPRGNAYQGLQEYQTPVRLGKSEVIHPGKQIAVLALGSMVEICEDVCQELKKDGYDPTFVNVRFVKPLDTALILQLAGEHDALVTLEENAIMGGAGSGVNEVLMAHRRAVPVLNIGLPDYFIPQGTQEEIRADLGLDAAGIEAKIRDWLA